MSESLSVVQSPAARLSARLNFSGVLSPSASSEPAKYSWRSVNPSASVSSKGSESLPSSSCWSPADSPQSGGARSQASRAGEIIGSAPMAGATLQAIASTENRRRFLSIMSQAPGGPVPRPRLLAKKTRAGTIPAALSGGGVPQLEHSRGSLQGQSLYTLTPHTTQFWSVPPSSWKVSVSCPSETVMMNDFVTYSAALMVRSSMMRSPSANTSILSWA